MINYLEEKIGLILWYLTFILLQLVIMFVLDMDTSFLIFSLFLYLILLSIYLIVSYLWKTKKNKKIKRLVDELDEKYLISELIKKPKNLKKKTN